MFRISLKKFLIICVCLAVLLGWMGNRINRGLVQKRELEKIADVCEYQYDYQHQPTNLDFDESIKRFSRTEGNSFYPQNFGTSQPPYPRWLVGFFGINFFAKVDHLIFDDVKDFDFNNLYPRNLDKLESILEQGNIKQLSASGQLLGSIDTVAKGKSLKYLDISHNPIGGGESLKSIAFLQDLIALNLDDTNVDDLSPITNLPSLEWLSLNDNPISSLSPIENASKLEQLSMFNAKIPDLSPLTNLPNLRFFSASPKREDDQRSIENLSNISFADGNNLQRLELEYFSKPDLSALRNCKNLKTLVIHSNTLKNISAIQHMTQLEELTLRSDLEHDLDINSVGSLTKLTSLEIQGPKVIDASPLANCKSLRTLDVTMNSMDTSFLAETTKLETLFVQGPFQRIDSLENLLNLENLRLDAPNVSDISGLERLKKMSSFTVFNSKIENFSPLAKLTKLQSIYINSELSFTASGSADTNYRSIKIPNLEKLNQLDRISIRHSDITQFDGLPKHHFCYLVIDECSLPNVEFLANCCIEYIGLTDTNLVDISPIASTTINISLDLSKTKVEDISILKPGTAILTEIVLNESGVRDLSPLIALPNLSLVKVDDSMPTEETSKLKTSKPGIVVYVTPSQSDE